MNMKSLMKKVIVATALLLTVNAASAGLIRVDLSSAGSQGVTLDTDTGIEWLGLSNTLGMSMNEALTAFSGWRVATQFEVGTVINKVLAGEAYENFFGSALQSGYGQIDYGSSRNSYYVQFTNKMHSVFQGGNTAPASDGRFLRVADGLHINDVTGGLIRSGTTIASNRYYQRIYFNRGLGISLPDIMDYKRADASVFLVSDGGRSFASLQDPTINANNANAPINNATAVSEPGALALLGLGLMGLAVSRKRKNGLAVRRKRHNGFSGG